MYEQKGCEYCAAILGCLDPKNAHSCCADQTDGQIRSKSFRPDLVLCRIKLKYYLLLTVARLRTRHAKYDFWASGRQLFAFDMEKNGVTQCNKWQFRCTLCCSDSKSKL